MGIEYSAKIMVGLPRGEIEDNDVIEEMDLDQAAPYYDGWEDAIIGICIHSSGDYTPREFAFDQSAIDKAKDEFKEATGQDGRLYLTPSGH